MKKCDNPLLKLEITNQALLIKGFANKCELAAKKDDGIIDKDEKKILDKINRLSEKYVVELNKLI